VGEQIADSIRLREQVEADPLFRGLAARYPEMDRRFAGPTYAVISFRATDAVLKLTFGASDGKHTRSLEGPLGLCAVGDLEPAVSAVMKQLRVAGGDPSAPAVIRIDGEGGAMITVGGLLPPRAARSYQGRLGSGLIQRF
jgi:hypothetical protein